MNRTIIEAICRHKYIELKRLAVIMVITLFAFLTVMQSTTNPLHIGDPLVDSSVFRYIAKEMQSGSIPYRDTFDHKGPLIYFINLAGMNLSYWIGVWIIEFLMMTLTFAAVYRIGRLYCDRMYSCLIACCVGSCLFKYFEGGNLVEEYALPFIAVSIYIFLDYFVNEKTNAFRIILCGFSFAVVCFLRINMATLWPIMCVGVIFRCIKSKTVLKRYIFLFLTGFLILTIPIIIWLTANGALNEFADCYIKYNILYSSQMGGDNRWQISFLHFLNDSMVLLSMGIVFYFVVKIHAFFDILYIVYMFTTLLLISMSGNTYMHYGMILVPMMTYPISRLFGALGSGYISKDINIRFGILYLTCIVSAPAWLNSVNNIFIQKSENGKMDFSDDLCYISRIIKENSSVEDKITVWGNWDAVYLLSDRMSSSYYSYQSACYVDQSMLEAYFRELEEISPKIIVGGSYDSLPEQLNSYISRHDYAVVGTNEAGTWNVYAQRNR